MIDDSLRRRLRDGDPLGAAPEMGGDDARRMRARVMSAAARDVHDMRERGGRVVLLRAAVAFATLAVVVGAIAWFVVRTRAITPAPPAAARVEAPAIAPPAVVAPTREPEPASRSAAAAPPAPRAATISAGLRRGGARPARAEQARPLQVHVVRQMHLVGPNGTRIILMIGEQS